MKKLILIVISLCLLFLFQTQSLAADIDFDNLEESVSDELFSVIDDDVLSALEEMGIGKNGLSGVYNFSLDSITSFFSTTLKEKAEKCFRDVFMLLCVIMITGTVSSLFIGSKRENFISQMSVMIITLIMVNIISQSLSAAVSVLRLSGDFMLSFVPIYTLVISLSGNAASALTYNSLIMVFAEAFSSVITYAVPELIGILFCLSISFSMNESINTGRFIGAVNKTVSVILGVAAGAFTGFLSLKNVLSVSVDSVSVKSIRFLIGSLIPVVGSSISEAYSTLLGSINLIKGSVAMVGILVVLIVNLPVILETLLYYFSFTVLSYLSDGFCGARVGEALRSFCCGIRILLLLCVFEMFILIVSTGLMLSLRGTV
ncbi:MAG: hypothetical protein IKB94_04145 [Clostridia bacterium]|nr:hypothetical protein [Clostridia bacterium]